MNSNINVSTWILFHNTIYRFLGKVDYELRDEYIISEYYTILENKVLEHSAAKYIRKENNKGVVEKANVLNIPKKLVIREVGEYENIEMLEKECVELFI